MLSTNELATKKFLPLERLAMLFSLVTIAWREIQGEWFICNQSFFLVLRGLVII